MAYSAKHYKKYWNIIKDNVSIILLVLAIVFLIFITCSMDKVTAINGINSSECTFSVYNLGYINDKYGYTIMCIAFLIIFSSAVIKRITAHIKSNTFTPIKYFINQMLKLKIYHIHPKYWIKKMFFLLLIGFCILLSINTITNVAYKQKFIVANDKDKTLVICYYYLLPFFDRKIKYAINADCSFSVDTWYSNSADYKSNGYVFLFFNNETQKENGAIDKIMSYEGTPWIAKNVGRSLHEITHLPVNIKKIE